MFCNIFGMLSASRRNESQTLCNDRVASSGLAQDGKSGKGGKLAAPASVEASEVFVPGGCG